MMDGVQNLNQNKMGTTLRLNIRILMWHLQIMPNWRFTWTYNDYHKGLKHGCFKVYEVKNLFKNKKHFDADNSNI
jgi:hypothetical protein